MAKGQWVVFGPSILTGHADSFVTLVGLVGCCPTLLFGQDIASHLSQLALL